MSNELTLLDKNMENGQLMIYNPQGELVAKFSEAQIEVAKNHIAKGATDDELYYFFTIAGMNNLNPLSTPPEIWFYKVPEKINGKKTGKEIPVIVPAVRGYEKKVKTLDSYQYKNADVIRENDDFKLITKGTERKIYHSYDFHDRGRIVGAWALVKLNGLPEFVQTVELKDVANKNNKTFWEEWTPQMVKKSALSAVYQEVLGSKGVAVVENTVTDEIKISDGVAIDENIINSDDGFIDADFNIKDVTKTEKPQFKIYGDKIRKTIEKRQFQVNEKTVLNEVKNFVEELDFNLFEVLDYLKLDKLLDNLRNKALDKFVESYHKLKPDDDEPQTVNAVKNNSKIFVVKDDDVWSEIGESIYFDDTVEELLKSKGIKVLYDEYIYDNVLELIEKNKKEEELKQKELEEKAKAKEEEYKKKAEKKKLEAEERRKNKENTTEDNKALTDTTHEQYLKNIENDIESKKGQNGKPVFKATLPRIKKRASVMLIDGELDKDMHDRVIELAEARTTS